VYRITDRGKALLNGNPSEITTKTLLVWFHKGGPSPGIGPLPTKEPEKALTPDEQIERSYLDLRDALAHDVLEATKKISPKAFERVVVDLLVAMGYGGDAEDAGQVVGKSGDGGIDGTIKQDKLGLDMVYVQAKRWQNNVGSPEVMGFCGSITAHRANKGVIITTSQFSKDAQEFVKRIPQNIVLIDGKRLADLMIDHDIGVASTPRKSYTLKRLDQDYFESLDL
jgi:restriction system protein